MCVFSFCSLSKYLDRKPSTTQILVANLLFRHHHRAVRSCCAPVCAFFVSSIDYRPQLTIGILNFVYNFCNSRTAVLCRSASEIRFLCVKPLEIRIAHRFDHRTDF